MAATAPLQDRRLWIGGGALVALILAAASWLLFIHPELSSASDLRSQKSTVDDQNRSTQDQNLKLEAQSRNIGALKTALGKALDALPPTSGLPDFTQEVNAYASGASVTLTSITVGNIAAANSNGTTGAAGSAASAQPGATTGTTGSTGTTGTTGTPATTSAAGSQYAITVTIQSEGSLLHQLTFLKAVEAGPRRVLVTSTQVSEAGGSRVASVDGATSMTSQLTIFSAPMSADQLAQLKHLLPSGN